MKKLLFMTIAAPLIGACSETKTGTAGQTSTAQVAAVSSKPSGSKPSSPSGPLRLGTLMPMAEVAMKNVDGKMLTLKSIAGEKGTLVVFTCNHCPYAKAWEGRVTALGNEFSKKGVGVVAVNPNDPSAYPEDGFDGMKARSKKLGMSFPYVVDATSDVARAYGATKTPEVYLFDAQGKLVYHGAVDDSANKPDAVEDAFLRNALTALVSGQSIEQPETKAIGCSIKFRPPA